MNKKKVFFSIVAIVLALALVGCSGISAFIGKLKGELFGNDYIIRQYDDFGNLIFTVYGDKVTMDCELDENGEVSSYIDITIDGESWKHVGSTLVFAQESADMITDFQIPAEMENEGLGSTGLMSVDRRINEYANFFGKELVVLISSQNGTPVALFQGNDVYTEIPGDLPKTTLIHIDGAMVYVHRANIDIIPAEFFKQD